jgi:hypothetical protein
MVIIKSDNSVYGRAKRSVFFIEAYKLQMSANKQLFSECYKGQPNAQPVSHNYVTFKY